MCCMYLILYINTLNSNSDIVKGLNSDIVRSPPVILIAGHPKAALLFWFFGDFRCGALSFMVIHVIYKYRNR